MRPSCSRTVEATICDGDVYYAGGELQTEAGTYYDTLKTAYGCDSLLVTKLILSVCTAVDPTMERTLRIYPVPANNILYVDVGGRIPQHIELVNSIGQRVRSTKKNYIDCSGLEEGNYYVRLYYDDVPTISRKVILGR